MGTPALLSLAALVSGNLDFASAWRAVLGLGLGRFNEILLIYATLFAILIAILPLIARYGSVPIVAVALFGWLLNPVFIVAFPDPPQLMNYILGVGTGYGPALLPAMTFLGFGIALGEALNGRRSYLLVVLMTLLAIVVVGSELSHGVMESGCRFLANRGPTIPGIMLSAYSGLLEFQPAFLWRSVFGFLSYRCTFSLGLDSSLCSFMAWGISG